MVDLIKYNHYQILYKKVHLSFPHYFSEYKLVGANTEKKNLSYMSDLRLKSIVDVSDGFIYFNGEDDLGDSKNIKCSQKTYNCEIIE